MTTAWRVGSVVVLVALAGSVAGAQTLVVSDTEFADADWVLDTLVGPNASSVSAGGSQGLSGGNPGAFRMMSHTVSNTVPGDFAFGWVWHRKIDDVVSLAGRRIVSVEYESDQRRVLSTGDRGTTSYAAVFQDGQVYLDSTGVVISQAWQGFDLAGLTAESFARVLPDGAGLDQTQRPDFSSRGSDLTFGYGYSNTPTDEIFDIVYQIDNWGFELTFVDSCDADLVEPFGVLDAADVDEALGLIGGNTAAGDWDGSGETDFFDVVAYLRDFDAGCP